MRMPNMLRLSLMGLLLVGASCATAEKKGEQAPADSESPVAEKTAALDTVALAAEVNASGPTIIDAHTRLDKAVGTPGGFTFKYTLLQLDSEHADVSIIKEERAASLVDYYCNHANTKAFRESGIRTTFEYSDQNGKPVTSVTVTNSQCDEIGAAMTEKSKAALAKVAAQEARSFAVAFNTSFHDAQGTQGERSEVCRSEGKSVMCRLEEPDENMTTRVSAMPEMMCRMDEAKQLFDVLGVAVKFISLDSDGNETDVVEVDWERCQSVLQ